MPPRFAFWTIILDGAPTSFRTRERDEILPLFNQLKAKNPTAELKWFSGGRLWDSPEQAKEARHLERVRTFREERRKQERDARERTLGPGGESGRAPEREAARGEDPLAEFRRQHGRPADGSDDPSTRRASAPAVGRGPSIRSKKRRRRWSRESAPAEPGVFGPVDSAPGPPKAERRGKDWRPGGEHKDPRDKYKLPPGAKRKRWKERHLGPRGRKPPHPSFETRAEADLPREDRRREARPFSDRPRGDRPQGDRPFGDRPRGDKPFGQKPFGSKPFGGKPKGGRPFGTKPSGSKPAGPGGPRRFGSKSSGGPGGYGKKPGAPGRGPGPGPGKPSSPRKPFGGRPSGPRSFDRRPPRDRNRRGPK
ncbi:MAG TPA: hypothetical protein PLN93_05705 [Vicinamibacterales bacterium]|nr:hypothetical protein [Vicinamibacterales bacterium]HOQ59355.1 hypothetical protein [Vicinamibacterales bacterium]HPK71413.1 hypothetical protein [Vicinamibacterales bacterium]